jgi:plastocyanin
MSKQGIPVVLVAVLLMACSGEPGGQGSGCQSTGADQTISGQDNNTFDRPNVTITKGDRVCWQNLGTVAHTVTAEFNASDTTWNIDGQLNPDLVVLKTFSTIGDYFYHCTFHRASGMTGVIHVR